MTKGMAPVQRTYGGCKPKRNWRIPEFIVKGSAETNEVFSALHIDNLKVVRNADPMTYKEKIKKTCKMTKDFKPTLNVSLDSTFDKILKDTNIGAVDRNAPGKCPTCGCVPDDLAHHALFECEDDIFYLKPRPKDVKPTSTGKKKSMKKNAVKARKKKLTLKSSTMSPSSKSIVDIAVTPIANANQTDPDPSIGLTSTPTPNLQCNRLTFGLESSPILLFDDERRNRSRSDEICENGQLGFKSSRESIDMVRREVTENAVESASIQVSKEAIDEKSILACVDGIKKCSLQNVTNSSVIESSVVTDPKAAAHTGYITERRRWRRNRLLMPCNISAVNSSSVDKSCQCHSHGNSGFPEHDRLRALSPSNNKFSPSVNSDKSDSIGNVAFEAVHVCESAASVKDPAADKVDTGTLLNELSREFRMSLNLSDQVFKELAQDSANRSSDRFSGLSFDSQKSVIQSGRFRGKLDFSVAIEADTAHMNLTGDRSAVLEDPLKLAPRASVINGSVKDSVIFDNFNLENTNDITIKPCCVRLYKCDSRTVADVTFESQSDESDYEDDENSAMNQNSDETRDGDSSSCHERKTGHQAVMTVPLSMLGKLSAVSVRNNTLSLESSLRHQEALEQASIAHMKLSEDAGGSPKERVDDNILPNETEHVYRDVLSRCGQTEPLPFEACYPESIRSECKKIGEGAYGEVFLHNDKKISRVVKIIPVEGTSDVNGAAQKKFWEIKPEIVVAQELSSLRKPAAKSNCTDGFNEVLAVRCVRGRYPKWMLDLWHEYDQKEGSENDCPDMFNDDQLYIVLELAHGGRDLESFTFSSADQAVSALAQIVFALAVGESEIQFEHRDLHWGNILVAPHDGKDVLFTLEGTKYKIATKGVKVSVIDFTMSRMTMPSTGENMFYDFGADEDLFAAQGDYQCDIYRLMRERTENNWAQFEPFTNILWLHYVLDKMCSMVAYRSRSSKLHQDGMRKLKKMRDAVLAYPSAMAFAQSNYFKSARVR